MIITMRSPRTGKFNDMDLPITLEQMKRWTDGKELIQNVFPNLSNAEREFLMTGYTQEDWDAIFPPEPDEPERKPEWGSQEWAETHGDDLGESPDY